MNARARSRGAAALVVVMVLFFIMMITVAYNGRSLVFEQRTSANQYRYTQAFEAGEAGLQWALTLLNGGRVDASCNPTSSAAHDTFRDRYLSVDAATGSFTPRAGLRAGCVLDGSSWTCSCPTTGTLSLSQPAGAANAPMFVVRFLQATEPGMVRVQASGCSNFGAQCLNAAAASTTPAARSDAFAQVDSLLALGGGLRTRPGAALTAQYNATFDGALFRVTNTDEDTSGITVNTGFLIHGSPELTSTPGTLGSNSRVTNDVSLIDLADRFFVNYFGTSPAMFRQLTMVRTIACSGDCTSAIRAQYDAGYRAFWINGDLALPSAATLGSATDPVLLAVSGNVELGGATVYGVVYSAADTWNNGTGSGVLHGAALAQEFRGGGSPHFIYDPNVLAWLHVRAGTFARVPGSWSDTQ